MDGAAGAVHRRQPHRAGQRALHRIRRSSPTGTRHRSAERAAIQTGYPVISVATDEHRDCLRPRGNVTYWTDSDHPVAGQPGHRNPGAVQTRLDEVSRQLSRAEIETSVTLRDVTVATPRSWRIGLVIDYDVVESRLMVVSRGCSSTSCSAATTPTPGN